MICKFKDEAGCEGPICEHYADHEENISCSIECAIMFNRGATCRED
jgi:hypothetical protein